jgi:hypothetical protein
MPPFKRLWLLPIVFLGAYWAITLLSPGWSQATQTLVGRTHNLIIELFGFAGCVIAALSFERGDYLRTAWMLQGLSLFALAVGVAARWLPKGTLPPSSQIVLVFLSNLFEATGAWLFARTWAVAGLELPGSRWSRGGVRVLALIVALVLAGPSAYSAIVALAHGGSSGNLIPLISAIGDTIATALTAPILMTALALRGGLIAWPWIFFAASMLCWLGWDMQDWMGDLFDYLHLNFPDWLGNVFGQFRTGAAVLTACAGIAQRWATRAQAEEP